MKQARLGYRWAFAGSLLTLAAPSRVTAEAPRLQAELTCEPASGPGRILCQLRSHAASGRLVWADGLVVASPSFAPPLRSRCLAKLDAVDGGSVASAKLALVASAPGQGRLELLARGVVCNEGPNGESCGPEVAHVSAEVVVGPRLDSAP